MANEPKYVFDKKKIDDELLGNIGNAIMKEQEQELNLFRAGLEADGADDDFSAQDKRELEQLLSLVHKLEKDVMIQRVTFAMNENDRQKRLATSSATEKGESFKKTVASQECGTGCCSCCKCFSCCLKNCFRCFDSCLSILSTCCCMCLIGSCSDSCLKCCKCCISYPVKYQFDFYNWGGTINTKNNEGYFFSVFDDDMVKWYHPATTRDDIRSIVKQATQDNKRIRCFGSRHSWSKFFGDDNTVLISMLPLIPALLNFDFLPEKYPDLELSQKDGDLNYLSMDEKSGILTVGGGVTNEMIRKYLVNSNSNWQIPMNVILVEVTAGGVLSMICHGAGKENPTISDIATSVEFVDPKGEVYEVPGTLPNGQEILKSASGAFGLFGVVTKLSLQLEKKAIAVYAPAKVPLDKAIPPPGSTSVDDIKAFYNTCEMTYSEFFWFPGSDQVWVNSWNTTNQLPDGKKLTLEYPDEKQTWVQEVRNYLFGQFRWMNSQLGRYSWWRTLRSNLAMLWMPDYSNDPVYTPKQNAIHFGRGIHNMKVRDTEMEIPLILEGSNEEDYVAWDRVRAFWSAAVEYVRNDLNVDLTLEMRLMGGSEVTLSPQKGNKYTLSIEILSMAPTSLNEDTWNPKWQVSMQGFYNLMCTVAEQVGIPPLMVRPHWAKETTLSVKELRQVFEPQNFSIFNSHLSTVAQSRGLTRKDFFQRFSNKHLDALFRASP